MSILDASTPADNKGYRPGPWGTIGIVAVGIGGALILAMSPMIWGTGTQTAQQDTQKREPGVAQPLEQWLDRSEVTTTQTTTTTAAPGPAPANYIPNRTPGQSATASRIGGTGAQAGTGGATTRRPPPPINISRHTGHTSGNRDFPADGRGSAQAQGTTQPAVATVGSPAPQMAAAAGSGTGNSTTSLAGQMGGGVQLGPAVKASYTAHPEYMITAGTPIPCLPIETYNSALGGMVQCQTDQWVRGNGLRRGLLPPGTRIVGQIRGGMAQGQPRLGVLYTHLWTSGDMMRVNFSGLGSDAKGRSGVDADIETFFWDTAGAVGLYSLITALTNAIPLALQAAIQQGNGNGNNTFVGIGSGFSGGGGGGQGLANRLLADRLNRQPEAERDWALPMFVTVGQDLDFYDVCRQRRLMNQMACPPM